MIEAARNAIQTEQEKALSTIRAEVVEISLHAASKVLGRTVAGEDDRRLVRELVSGTREGQA
jgi:F0F1-type ATP synthase membrane subunit b/b'